MILDLVLRNGMVVDGTGNPWFKADVGIKGGRVVDIGVLDSVNAETKVDVSKLIVSPGFCDIHSHSDLYLLVNRKAESKVMQGITTDVIGNCGFSPAPLTGVRKDDMDRILFSWDTLGDKIRLDWKTLGGYLDRLEAGGIALNVASYVGFGNVRSCVLGFDDRPPNSRELQEMKGLVDQSMQQGAFGLSSGLKYAPQCYGKTGELIELCKVVVKHGGIYASHIRDEGDIGGAQGLIASVEEAIEIGRKGGVPVDIEHHEAIGREAWGASKKTLKIIEQAKVKGVDIAFNAFTYETGPSSLAAWLPLWARVGGKPGFMKRMKDPETRRKMKAELRRIIDVRGGPSTATISEFPEKIVTGKTIEQVAELRKKDPYETAMDLLEEAGGDVSVSSRYNAEEDILRIIRHPLGMIASDGVVLADRGPLSKGAPSPVSFGTFPRILRKFVREEGILSLEDAVRRMTSFPSWRIGLKDRGILRPGMWADIVVFDSNKVADKSTYEDPVHYPVGISHVLVNGKFVVRDGKQTKVLPGKVLRRGNKGDK